MTDPPSPAAPAGRWAALVGILSAKAEVRQWERVAVWAVLVYVLNACFLHVSVGTAQLARLVLGG